MRHPGGATLALVALAAALLGGRLAAGDLVGDPVIYAALAKAVVRRGEWGTPYLAGQPFFDKPPLVVWLAAVSFLAFGVATWSARLVGVAASVGCCLATARLGARLAGGRAGLVAGAVLALTPGFVRFGSTLLLDSPFVLCALAGFLAVIDAFERDGRGLWRAGAWFGAAFMAKGAQTLVLSAILLVTWIASPAAGRPPFRKLLDAGGAFLAVALPWHAWMIWRWDGAFLHGAAYDVAEKMGPAPALAVYVRAVVVTTLPWLPLAAFGMWRARRRAGGVPLRLLAVWTGLAYGILLVAGKQSPRYLMLLHPALAIWSAVALAPWLPDPGRLARAIGGAALVAWLVVLLWPRSLHPTGTRAAVVALEPALAPKPAPIDGFRLRHEGTRARFYFYLDRDVQTTDDLEAVARLPRGTPIVTATRDAPTLADDPRFVEARRSRDFAVFRRVQADAPSRR